METTEIEFSILIDQDGDFVIAKDVDELGDLYENDISSTAPSRSRTLTFKLTVPLPRATEITATVPDKGDEPVNIEIS